MTPRSRMFFTTHFGPGMTPRSRKFFTAQFGPGMTPRSRKFFTTQFGLEQIIDFRDNFIHIFS
jgi:hypothetical protein